MVYEAVKFGNFEEKSECEVCFSNEESAIEYIGKYLAGQGCVRVREYTKKHKIFDSLEDYENYIANEME